MQYQLESFTMRRKFLLNNVIITLGAAFITFSSNLQKEKLNPIIQKINKSGFIKK